MKEHWIIVVNAGPVGSRSAMENYALEYHNWVRYSEADAIALAEEYVAKHPKNTYSICHVVAQVKTATPPIVVERAEERING